jgi:uncharacterized protein
VKIRPVRRPLRPGSSGLPRPALDELEAEPAIHAQVTVNDVVVERESPAVFDLVVAAVVIPLGTWLVLTRPAPAGGSILAPILIADSRPPSQVAPAALTSTFVTSLAGVVTFTLLSVHQHGSVAPNWPTGIAPGHRRAGGRLSGRAAARPAARNHHPAAGPSCGRVGVRYLLPGLT